MIASGQGYWRFRLTAGSQRGCLSLFVPLFILSIITYQVLVDVEPRSAKMSVNDGTQRSHAPYGPSVPFTVPLGGLRAATITLHVGENAPTKFSLGRWKVLLYSLQATKLGRHFGFAPLPLRFCYKIPHNGRQRRQFARRGHTCGRARDR